MSNKLYTCLLLIAGLLFVASPGWAAGKKAQGKEKSMEQNSCVATAKGPLTPAGQPQAAALPNQPQAAPVLARVGHPAPDFEANAFINGNFKNLKLSDSKGKWTVLCFYPGDFTFV
jgi:hypothetical protein